LTGQVLKFLKQLFTLLFCGKPSHTVALKIQKPKRLSVDHHQELFPLIFSPW